jgi:hypothetical protein
MSFLAGHKIRSSPDALRSGRGLDIFHIATAYLYECARLRCFYAEKAGYDKMTTILKTTLKDAGAFPDVRISARAVPRSEGR